VGSLMTTQNKPSGKRAFYKPPLGGCISIPLGKDASSLGQSKERNMAKLKRIAEACMWLPGFAPEEDPIEVLGVIPETAKVIPLFPAVAEPAKVDEPKPVKQVWPKLQAAWITVLNGDVTKYEANVAAIRLMQSLTAEGRYPTPDERITLSQYTGWGGLSKAFNTFQDTDAAWTQRINELEGLLGGEYDSAKASVNNAHYTPVEVIESMWAGLRRIGFKGGRIIETSAGIGHFLGAMPQDMAEVSEITAVEIDTVSGKMLERLYGNYGVNVKVSGIEKVKFPEGWFDLAISNVPFGAYKVPDGSNRPYASWNIHDYFFGRALDLVRPGGIIAFVTSTGTLDKWDEKVRRYLANRARLLGAVRLPGTAFKQIANTEVTTDIIFLKKYEKDEVTEKNPEWMTLCQAPLSACKHAYERHNINNWYVKHPEWMLGKLVMKSNGYRRDSALEPHDDKVLEQSLYEVMALLPEGVYSPRKATTTKLVVTSERLDNPLSIKPGAYCLTDDGRLAVSEGHTLKVIEGEVKGKTAERIRGMIDIRHAARKLLGAQVATDEDGMLAPYQIELNSAYDAFVAKFGYLTERANRLAFRGDPDIPLLLALERYDDEAGVAEKADIFFRRTVKKPQPVKSVDTVGAAIAVSLHEKGYVCVKTMERLLGKPFDSFRDDAVAQGLLYLNPETMEWQTADHYLSGNVRDKLVTAEAAGPEFDRNVESLRKVIPEDLDATQIEARLGSTWIPTTDVEAFINAILETKGAEVTFSQKAGSWDVKVDWQAQRSVAATQIYGTNRSAAHELIAQALNQQVPTIKDKDYATGRYVTNPSETLAAREKQAQIKDKFKTWIWEDTERRERLSRLYNDRFNAVRTRHYDGSHLTLPGFSMVYKLHQHQMNTIWRGISSGMNVLMAHAVGAGKTLSAICTGMEMKRLGMANKPAYVVPNHMLEQFAAEFLRAYPTANILMATKEDLEGDKRRLLLSRIATGDWDGVLMTHSVFERIKIDDQVMAQFIEDQMAELEATILEAKQDRDSRIVKQLEITKKNWKAKWEKLNAEGKKDGLLSFEELGFDQLFVDEAHYFKNLFRFSKMSRIAGLPNTDSQRAFDMFVKTRHIMDKHEGKRGVCFMTGTPVSNSMAELYTMQRYLQPQTLVAHMSDHFDAWAGNFGESVTSLEVAPDGSGYRMNTRFARFVNLPELMAIFREIADIQTAEMMNLPTPKAIRKTISAKASAELKLFVEGLVKRAEEIRNGSVTPNEDNMLAVTNDGRKAALDMRMVNPLAGDTGGSKVSQCVEQTFEVWQETAAFKGTQLIFCDLSTPSSASGRFSVYDDIRGKLLEQGVPANEIAFIHDYDTDAQKESLFRSVREGRVRILLGSTSKMGVGTNVQTRLVALHHLDAPWRPSDIEQREGRIVRQGNMNAEVLIYRYVTEGSFDSYMWQTLETKAKFIAQIMCGDSTLRTAEDLEMAALSYAEVKALACGNPLVIEKAGIDGQVTKLSVLRRTWQSQLYSNKSELAALPGRKASARSRIAGIGNDLCRRKNIAGREFKISLGKNVYTDRTLAAKALHEIYSMARKERGVSRESRYVPVGEFAGFGLSVHIPAYHDARPYFVLQGDLKYECEAEGTAEGLMVAVEQAVSTLDLQLERAEAQLAILEKREADISAQMDQGFEFEERLTQLLARQREIEVQLGLHKDEAGAMEAEAA
jgi:N12 class adenine-specific DNA methylase